MLSRVDLPVANSPVAPSGRLASPSFLRVALLALRFLAANEAFGRAGAKHAVEQILTQCPVCCEGLKNSNRTPALERKVPCISCSGRTAPDHRPSAMADDVMYFIGGRWAVDGEEVARMSKQWSRGGSLPGRTAPAGTGALHSASRFIRKWCALL